MNFFKGFEPTTYPGQSLVWQLLTFFLNVAQLAFLVWLIFALLISMDYLRDHPKEVVSLLHALVQGDGSD